MGYEVLTAFFLEAGFLGVMLFGHGKVSEPVHLMATFFVAFGTTLSAFWILALNSWMQTPAGHEIINGEFEVKSWFEVIFNPSFPYRFTHNHYEIAVPKGASLILTHQADGEIKGLDEFPGAHPPPLPVFFGFRIMVGVGMLMLATSWVGWVLYRRARWQPARLPRPLLWLLAGMTFSGWVATVAGWYVTEIGRQPFVVYGLVRTADVASKVPAAMIVLTLALYVTLYLALIVAYVTVLKYLAEKPEEVLRNDAADQAATPAGATTSPVVQGGAA